MKVALYFGSFNPIHIGHLIIANHVLEHTDNNQLWFVVSPHNPLKDKKSLLKDAHRLNMVKIAIENDTRFRASDIEFQLKQPSFTIHTLEVLKERYPETIFSLVLGGDNLNSLSKWYNYKQIIDNFQVFVYPRGGEKFDKEALEFMNLPTIKILENTPSMNLSASFIRTEIQNKRNIKYLVTREVEKYIDEMNFYR